MMGVSKAASTTLLWVKELSSSFFNVIGKKLFRGKFLRRNFRVACVLLILWVLIIVGAFVFFHTACRRHEARVFEQGTVATRKLAERTGVPLLSGDILALNAAIRDFESLKHTRFIAILDHGGIIMAHTRSELINHPFQPLTSRRILDEADGVRISSGTTIEGEKVVCFSRDVIFSKVVIGRIHFAFSGAWLWHLYDDYKLLLIGGFVAITLLLAMVLLIFDRVAKARLQRVQKEMEGMTCIGPYILRRKIGQGGMAELHLADYVREDGFRKVVAVKIVLPHLLQYPEFAKMFIREARLAALLQHPNIVQIIDFGRIENASFLAMEYVHGKNLAELMARVGAPLPVDLCIFLMLQVSRGLHYSHMRKNDETGEPLHIVHRDISPQNLLISFQGEVKITDFGISKAKSEPSLTQAGVIKGKLAYMAPEQVLGEAVNHQADIYAMGIVFYEILSNRRLYQFSTDSEAINKIPKMEIPPVKNLRAGMPVGLNEIVMKCLEKALNRRYQSAKLFYDDLMLLKKRHHMVYDESNLIAFMRRHFGEEDGLPHD